MVLVFTHIVNLIFQSIIVTHSIIVWTVFYVTMVTGWTRQSTTSTTVFQRQEVAWNTTQLTKSVWLAWMDGLWIPQLTSILYWLSITACSFPTKTVFNTTLITFAKSVLRTMSWQTINVFIRFPTVMWLVEIYV